MTRVLCQFARPPRERENPSRAAGGAACSPGPARLWPTPRLRASWDEYFMNIASEVSTRSTCDRKFVGAVIVRDKSILATGYNGSIRGLPHCDEEGHLMEDGHCVRTVHAEANAIVQAARNGVRIEGATIYVTASPCWGASASSRTWRPRADLRFGEVLSRPADLRRGHAPGHRALRHVRQEEGERLTASGGRSRPLCVAVVQGGPSTEAEVSRASAAGVARALAEAGHQVVRLELDVFLAESLRTGGFDVVFPVAHGAVGEDGSLQGLLEVLELPYVGSQVLASALAMDKRAARVFFERAGLLPVAKGVAVRRGDARAAARRGRIEVGARLVVKPSSHGSAIGVARLEADATEDAVAKAIEEAWAIDDVAILEHFAERVASSTCGVLELGEPPTRHAPADRDPVAARRFLYVPGQVRARSKHARLPAGPPGRRYRAGSAGRRRRAHRARLPRSFAGRHHRRRRWAGGYPYPAGGEHRPGHDLHEPVSRGCHRCRVADGPVVRRSGREGACAGAHPQGRGQAAATVSRVQALRPPLGSSDLGPDDGRNA